ncbi:unnamed protein product [Cyprideis torosa]|uniref:Uncharacterized protein n=1 Tax=Cyprideis torosa TaxID=163714 RepID=A0A7R8WN03_9CRUS|nr:unnamed protein product [Cyprideis torosa]CAG0905716.1 unnamed protein product [Cyprideis torosa]
MKNVIIFGPPGAGKGTQSEKIIEVFGFTHISTGDVFRWNKANQTPLGLEAQKYMDKGELVPDELTIRMLKDENAKYPDAKGMLLDGFPRTVPQAEALDLILEADGEKVDLVIQLDVPEEVIRERIAKRAESSGRADDAEASTVERRMKEYFEKTIHVIPYYEVQDKVLKVNGVGSIDSIFELIAEGIRKQVVQDDHVRIYCQSGKGGAGSASLRREKFVDKGGPDGGDGGRGGHIILKSSSHKWTLLHLRYFKHIKADAGKPGGKQGSTGADGQDIILEVPVGTIAKTEDGEVLAELTEEGQEEILLEGGKGGRGNTHFKSATNQTPRYAQPGLQGKEALVILELKVLADVGLVGFPNAGKSTLLAAITAAKPKIADYAFTTLTPNLGIVPYRDYRSFVMADIPGIIEGAAEGKGLGHRFLRHIERNSVLLFLIPADAEDYHKEYHILLGELEKYNPELLDKDRLIAISKSDLLDDELKNEIQKELKGDFEFIFISSVSQEGLDVLKDRLWKMINDKEG